MLELNLTRIRYPHIPTVSSGLTCSEDWVEAWWVGREGSRVPLGRWCGLATPGPLHSPRGALGLMLALHTDTDAVASGFKARYIFEVHSIY